MRRLQVEGSHAAGISGAGAALDRETRFTGKRKGLTVLAMGRESDWKVATASALAALQVRPLLYLLQLRFMTEFNTPHPPPAQGIEL